MLAANMITGLFGLVSEPELRFTPAGKAVCKFRVANTPRRKNAETNRYEDQEPTWISVTAWGKQAEAIAESGWLKGTRLIIAGELISRTYETSDGTKRIGMEIPFPELIGVDTMFHIVKATKYEGGGNGNESRGSAQPTGARASTASAVAGSASFDDEPPW